MNIFEILKAKRLTKEQKLQKATESMIRHSSDSMKRAIERAIQSDCLNLKDWNPATEPHKLINTVVIAALEHEAETYKRLLSKIQDLEQIEKDVKLTKELF